MSQPDPREVHSALVAIAEAFVNLANIFQPAAAEAAHQAAELPAPEPANVAATVFDETPTATVDDVKDALEMVLKQRGMGTAKSLLARFDANKMTDVPAAAYASFVQACREAVGK